MSATAGPWWVRWLFPPRCQGCARLGPEPLCASCLATIPLGLLPRCEICGAWFDPLATARRCAECRRRPGGQLLVARAAAAHEGLTRRLVLRYKYQRRHTAGAALGRLWARWLAADSEAVAALDLTEAVLVPVPLHRRRERWRGFNQALSLAESLAAICEAPVVEALVRTRPTRPQVRLRGAQRERNVKGAFDLAEVSLDRARTYVLVDDVYTTGATLRECARTLRRAGAKEIRAVTVARPVSAELVELARRLSEDLETLSGADAARVGSSP